MHHRPSVLVAVLTAAAALALAAVPSAAHTETDVVAVPAGGAATVTLAPTHGCDGSPTVEVSIRAPLAGATAAPVEGWTESAADDGAGNTVLTWTGGLLPDDQVGAFPVEFTAPDTVGELLTFPSVQTCEDGEELAWISGDPASDYPAPRLLILAADAEPAATIDDVPADAPGRDQLVAIVDVDGQDDEPEPPETPEGDTTTTEGDATTSAPEPDDEEEAASPAPATAGDGDDDGGDSTGLLVGGGLLALVAAVGGYALWRRSQGDTAET